MVDFSKLKKSRTDQAPSDPRIIFKRQPKPAGINDLWQSQREVLDAWIARRTARDLVIKLNTGGGKTLVGLLIAQAEMNRVGRGALYLCPDRQLAEQTLAKAKELQLAVVPFPQKGPLPPSFLNGEATLVATYRALFNGLSKFGTRTRPRIGGDPFVQVSAIICDDAHTAFADLRSAFSVTVTRRGNADLYRSFASQFRDGFESVGRIGSYDLAVGGQDNGVFEVPYSVWRQQVPLVRQALLADASNEEFKFSLPLLLDALPFCHVLVSSTAITITTPLPLISQLPTFAEAHHRVFMSATIADDGALIRTFDVDRTAVEEPIAPESLAGVGERMILVPALSPVGASDELAVAKLVCSRAARAGVGVVILAPSERRAKLWKDLATVVLKDDVAQAVTRLLDRTAGDNGPYVFANRYAGIDLPGAACRVLVFDGLPQGATDYDIYRATVLRSNSKIDLSLAQRVEQGMGRGTRGAGDYCVVLLLGDLVDWIARKDGVAMLTEATRVQLDVGVDLSRAVASEADFYATVDQCLSRDPDWVTYHAEQLADKNITIPVSVDAVAGAVVERTILSLLERNDIEKAARFAESSGLEHSTDRHFRGWILQLAARAYDLLLNSEKARALQSDAYSANPALNRASGATQRARPHALPQAESIAEIVDRYERRLVLQQTLATAMLPLNGQASADQFEKLMWEIGHYLGFGSFRHDGKKGAGPDNAWVVDGSTVFVLSCKNEKGPKAPLYKKELGTLLVDTQWVKAEYPGLHAISVVIQENPTAAEHLPIDDIYVLTPTRLRDLVGALTNVYGILSESQLDIAGLRMRAGELLESHGLMASQIVNRYMQQFVTEVNG